MRKFGLIGYPLGHSFSGNYFREKFLQEQIADCVYSNYEIDSISGLRDILKDPELEGLNVTIPYKESVIPFLHKKDPVVTAIGASNCIRIKDGILTGFNTDVIGFEKSLIEKLTSKDEYALILGTGGSSKAVAWVLQQKGIRFLFVSRKLSGQPDQISYSDLNRQIIEEIYPHYKYDTTGHVPELRYQCRYTLYIHRTGSLSYLIWYTIHQKHYFLKKEKLAGARIKNGADMLAIQAEASWEIWNKPKA